jgi:hypothetical protein
MSTRTFSVSPVRKAERPLPDHKQDWAWINEHLDELRGQWVMMHEERLVSTNPNIRQLLNQIPRDAYPDAMITYVPTEEEAQLVIL